MPTATIQTTQKMIPTPNSAPTGATENSRRLGFNLSMVELDSRQDLQIVASQCFRDAER